MQLAFVADHQSAGVGDPGEGSLHLPAATVASELPSVLHSVLARAQLGRNQVNAPVRQALSQGVAVSRSIFSGA